ncbi:MAG: multiheme c-type cytochrome [Candidatus Latescibacterota bacterium]
MEDPSFRPVHQRAAQWRSPLTILVCGLLVFETLSGPAIWLLPFSLPAQFSVLVHTGAGVLWVAPCLWYLGRHLRLYRQAPWTHVKLTGYLGLVLLALCAASGLVLTAQALWGRRIGYAWDLVHLLSTVGVVGLLLPHVVLLTGRHLRAVGNGGSPLLAAARRRFALGLAGVVGVFGLCVAAWCVLYTPVELHNALPPDYDFAYGSERPFAPSLSVTASGGAYDARSLGGSASCGTSGCHEEILGEWQASAHRYAAMDAAFQAVQNVMAEQNGPTSTRYCGGCHDPISLFSGTKTLFAQGLTDSTGYQEGVSCIVCHAVQQTDVRGNADYTVAQPERYAYEMREPEGRGALLLRDFLIRAYPDHHVATLSRRLFKSPEFCAACHKQFIDAEINHVGWVQLQNQYDNWRMSRWNHKGDPTRTVECRECHMPLISGSSDPASGDALDYNRSAADGRHRSHRFLGANQFMPVLHDLPGGQEHVRLTEKWLRGEVPIPEIEAKWSQGPAVPIELDLPAAAVPGESVDFRVVMTNNKAGHDFPTGPLDIIQAWVEVEVRDGADRVLLRSGRLDERRFIEPGTFMFKAEPVDQYGNLIDRHNLWEMVGVRYRRSLFPGSADAAEYTVPCPSVVDPERPALPRHEDFAVDVPAASPGPLHVEARLLYRKVDQYLLNFLMGEEAGLTAPVTAVSEARGTVPVAAPAAASPAPAPAEGG